MADVKNGGGYGRFYDTTETNTPATTATTKETTKIVGSSTVTGSVGSTEYLEAAKKNIISGSTKSGSYISSQLPGVQTANQNVAQSQVDLNLKNAQAFQTRVKADLKPPLPNVLGYYTSYNYIFTLSVLNDEQLNFPDATYKKGKYGPLILRSGGGAPDKELVQTAYGKYDFFLDDLKLTGIIGFDKSSGNTNSTNISFRIIEPYSMGLFFQAVQVAALQAKHENYIQMPLLLTIEFKGHVFDNDSQLLNVQIDKTTKHIPLKLMKIAMHVSGKGTTYDVEAIPWNEQGFSTEYNEVKTPISITMDTGKYTVQNMLQSGEQSLQKVLNDYFKERVKNKDVSVSNQILILFPADLTSDTNSGNKTPNEKTDSNSATVNNMDASGDAVLFKNLGVAAGTGKNTSLIQSSGEKSVNQLGMAKMGFNIFNKGDTPFPKDVEIYDPATGKPIRGDIQIDYNNSSFKFAQGASVVDIINQVILMSDFGRNALSEAQRTPEGQITWWRIETQVYNLGAAENLQTGTKPKLVVFRVVPYKVDSSIVLPPNTKRPKLDNLKQQALKEYNYIYTGKNTEVLDFNIEFNAGFYTALAADGNKNSEVKDLGPASGGAANLPSVEDQKRGLFGAPFGNPPNSQGTPHTVKRDKIESSSAKLGSGGVDDEITKVARQFQDVITSGVDMISMDLTILGDPYYIQDSGLGNYSAKGVEGFDNITADGGINYQNGEVVISVNFRTPVDLNQDTGFYNFGDTRPVLQFSGLYRVFEILSEFNRGKFKQTLKMFRIRGQDNPSAAEPVQTSIVASENTTDAVTFNQNTNNSILSAIGAKPNNVNKNAPNTALPGVVNTGGVTI
jgi:hypothetical protein